MPRKQANEGRIKKSFIIYGHEHGHEYPVNIPLTQILKEFRYSETAYFGVWDTSLQQLQAEDVRSKIILMRGFRQRPLAEHTICCIYALTDVPTRG